MRDRTIFAVTGPPPSRGRDHELEGGVDACHVKYVYESRHYRARSTEERRRIRRKKKNAKWRFFASRGAYVNLGYIAMFWKSVIEHDGGV